MTGTFSSAVLLVDDETTRVVLVLILERVVDVAAVVKTVDVVSAVAVDEMVVDLETETF